MNRQGRQEDPVQKRCPVTGRPIRLLPTGPVGKWTMPLVGFAAFLWFAIRVIPKPSRAAYPCQRMAAPLAAGFVLWAAGAVGSALAWTGARKALLASRYGLAALCLLAVLLAGGAVLLSTPQQEAGAAFAPSEPPNSPMGTAQGIQPGRVVWVHDPAATPWDGSQGNYWDAANTDLAAVADMLDTAVCALAGEETAAASWDALFRSYNRNHGRGESGYCSGEIIAVKLNLNQSTRTDRSLAANAHITTPQTILALVRQLVLEAGVDDGDIVLYDACRYVPDVLYVPLKAEFPNIRFADYGGGLGREQVSADLEHPVAWSWGDKFLPEEGASYATFLPSCVVEADYLINAACLRAHQLAGVTLCGKNHYGSFCADVTSGSYSDLMAPKGAGVHPYIAAHAFNAGPGMTFPEIPMGSYNPIVDLMGHAELGAKTVLYLIDGLYSPRDGQEGQVNNDSRWQSAPFNGDWTSSLLVSQDATAIDSVGLDLLAAEPTLDELVRGTVDNYLHEAAQANSPPSGAFYDPEGDGSRLGSLGVHEHWSGPDQKLYSRNLGAGTGIELVAFSPAGNIPPWPWETGDVNHDCAVNAIDVQRVVNMALGLPTGCDLCDLNRDRAFNAVDVQRVINAALGI